MEENQNVLSKMKKWFKNHKVALIAVIVLIVILLVVIVAFSRGSKKVKIDNMDLTLFNHCIESCSGKSFGSNAVYEFQDDQFRISYIENNEIKYIKGSYFLNESRGIITFTPDNGDSFQYEAFKKDDTLFFMDMKNQSRYTMQLTSDGIYYPENETKALLVNKWGQCKDSKSNSLVDYSKFNCDFKSDGTCTLFFKELDNLKSDGVNSGKYTVKNNDVEIILDSGDVITAKVEFSNLENNLILKTDNYGALYMIKTDESYDLSKVYTDIEIVRIKADIEAKAKAEKKTEEKTETEVPKVQQQQQSTETNNYDGWLVNDGTKNVPIFASEEAIDEFLDCLKYEDDEGLGNLFLTGQMWYASENDKCKFIEQNFGSVKIKIVTGDVKGTIGWIFSENWKFRPDYAEW